MGEGVAFVDAGLLLSRAVDVVGADLGAMVVLVFETDDFRVALGVGVAVRPLTVGAFDPLPGIDLPAKASGPGLPLLVKVMSAAAATVTVTAAAIALGIGLIDT